MSAIFIFGKADMIRSETVSDHQVPTSNKLTQQYTKFSYQNEITVPISDEEKGLVQLLPVYKKENAPQIKLLPIH